MEISATDAGKTTLGLPAPAEAAALERSGGGLVSETGLVSDQSGQCKGGGRPVAAAAGHRDCYGASERAGEGAQSVGREGAVWTLTLSGAATGQNTGGRTDGRSSTLARALLHGHGGLTGRWGTFLLLLSLHWPPSLPPPPPSFTLLFPQRGDGSGRARRVPTATAKARDASTPTACREYRVRRRGPCSRLGWSTVVVTDAMRAEPQSPM